MIIVQEVITIGTLAAGAATFNPTLIEFGIYSAVGVAASVDYVANAGQSSSPGQTFQDYVEWPLDVIS